eukprot:CAMPEP_0197862476 /NCGR_PEP_ID=MMETSP1438-20131217/39269_1 /TAXON_ID=1461541 /ORGANISM="Pterosperma sp., Strain CCMP1384" /LENGTH=509 /DNA_ID=CAMNT_0043480049 /DNA_START=128 /DNA_END=1658 /DNA_ORIENTATION=+
METPQSRSLMSTSKSSTGSFDLKTPATSLFLTGKPDMNTVTSLLGSTSEPTDYDNVGFSRYMEIQRAKGEENTTAALRYAELHQKDTAVQSILRRVGDMRLLEGCSWPPDPRKFRGLVPILTTLFQAGETSDENLASIFGEAKYVKGTLMEFVHLGNPMGSMGGPKQQIIDHSPTKAQVREKQCDTCDQVHGDYIDGVASKGQVEIFTCSGCRVARYCSQACQAVMWKIHKPACMRAQGQVVSEEMEREANELFSILLAKKTKDYEAQQHAELDDELNKHIACYMHNDSGWDHQGRARTNDLPGNGLDLADNIARKYQLVPGERTKMSFNPACMKDDSEVALYTYKGTKTEVGIFYTSLYAGMTGEGTPVGVAVDGICVKVHGEWRKVAGPGCKDIERIFADIGPLSDPNDTASYPAQCSPLRMHIPRHHSYLNAHLPSTVEKDAMLLLSGRRYAHFYVMHIESSALPAAPPSRITSMHAPRHACNSLDMKRYISTYSTLHPMGGRLPD